MELLTYILLLALSGLIVGAIGRLLVPGPDPMGILSTIGVGLLGSFTAGLVARLLFDSDGAGLILAVLFTALFVWLFRRDRVLVR